MPGPLRIVGLLTWIVSETSCVAAGFEPDVVNGQTTSPQLVEAFRRNRYQLGQSLPIYYWDRQREVLPAPLYLGGQWGDTPIWPYASERWTSGERPGPATVS